MTDPTVENKESLDVGDVEIWSLKIASHWRLRGRAIAGGRDREQWEEKKRLEDSQVRQSSKLFQNVEISSTVLRRQGGKCERKKSESEIISGAAE